MANLVKAYEAAIGKEPNEQEEAARKNELAESSLLEQQRRLRREAWLSHEFTLEFLQILAANRSEALKHAEAYSHFDITSFNAVKNALYEARILTKVISYANTGNY